MLPLFTQLLKDFLVRQNVAPANRITLGPPDRAFVGAFPPGQSVNIYLADIRENRKLRTNERRRDDPGVGPGGNVRESLYPAWVDAHYVITAWDTAIDQSARALTEHQILAGVSSALLAGDPFTPREVYPDPTNDQLLAVEAPVRANAEAAASAVPGTTPQSMRKAGDDAARAASDAFVARLSAPLLAWPQEFRVPGLPYQVLPPEGFPKVSEFWTTMGAGSFWKPFVYLVAAVPVELKPQFEFPIVTTMKTASGQTDDAPSQRIIRGIDKDGSRSGTERDWYQIGGFVSRFDGPRPLVPVKRAKVVLQTAGDPAAVPPTPFLPLQETRTDDDGKYQFLFAGPLPGEAKRFQVLVLASGLTAPALDVVLSPVEPFPHDVVMQPA